MDVKISTHTCNILDLVKVLGVYEWSGCNPLPPEFWLLPKFSPIHPGMSKDSYFGVPEFPCATICLLCISSETFAKNYMLGKMLCYCRLVYMPMSYLYGKRFVGPITSLIRSLREEMYNERYDQINWNKARNNVAKVNGIFIFNKYLFETFFF